MQYMLYLLDRPRT
ncbi:hypothetical protein CUMW_196830 [Citrus unshiu]|uniref:Uncharacterized protein n=1 Tax=Citrus unshiu TaxID=55188 RepID=A0A2H5Q563_CITUN|nr:hypothetical protein CUMW_196830 [Citrus unshiu]